MAATDALVAATRFGLGAMPDGLDPIASDPRGWLRSQLDLTPPPSSPGVASSGTVAAMGSMRNASEKTKEALREARREAYQSSAQDWCTRAAGSSAPFAERLVGYWANHFTVSVARNEVLAVAGSFQDEVIRPHVFGTFEDMLVASTRHPAMLLYLDNIRSIGPDSIAGARRGKGLNENLAREILELHTLGVGAYSQGDVEALACILTGWGIARFNRKERSMEVDGAFVFEPVRHQPGAKTLLGSVYPEAGEEEGRAALKALARHPSTAANVATRMARHFLADTPSPQAIEALTKTFLETEGDLRAMAEALIDLPDAWDDPLGKMKTPWDLVISCARGLGLPKEGKLMAGSMRRLGQRPFGAPSPQGWSDDASDWLGPEGMLSRLDWCQRVARMAPTEHEPLTLAERLLGPALTRPSRSAIRDAPSREVALALLLASPEFQRR